MRIISGSFKGKKILEPQDIKTRPLKDLTKESIFNIINHSNKFKINLNNSIILDLPDPQLLINWAEKSLLLGGKLSCYIPTINQVEDLLSSLSNWSEIEINEMMHRKWQSKIDAIRPETNMLGHTGFIVSARLLNK